MITIADDERQALREAAECYGTPCYVYFWDRVKQQVDSIRDAFGDTFLVSYAVKANPNPDLLGRLGGLVDLLDVSSRGELDRCLQLGADAGRITFSGPGKSTDELKRAVATGCEIVCESQWELATANQVAADAGKTARVLIRINPLDAPKGFSVAMSKRASQFGIDQECLSATLEKLTEWNQLELVGFHVYSGTNLLEEEPLIENFGILCELFDRVCVDHALSPRRLVFGAGFGIPYEIDLDPLDLGKIASGVESSIRRLTGAEWFRDTQLVLETGRYIVGPAGYFLVSVLNEKESRGKSIRICDGGMNHHLAACNLMGSIIRRNWPMWKVNESPDDSMAEYWLVGPLCTTIDTLAYEIELPELSRGDLVAIGSSGAYGLTSSPTRFISHPEPRELLVEGTGPTSRIMDVSVSHDRRDDA